MDHLHSILMMLVTLGILVTIHEYGHFWVARRCGVKVLRFSIGFGKPFYTWHDKQGTEFALALLPLGGYVKMVDEREGDVAPEDLDSAFTSKSVWQRIAIVAAGPLANFLLAWVVYWGLYTFGITGVSPVVGAVEPASMAEQANLEVGQEIVMIDGQDTPTWQAVHMALLRRIGETGEMDIGLKYADSDFVYHSTISLDNWLSDVEAPYPVEALGIEPFVPKRPIIIDRIEEGSAAEQAKLLPGDEIVAADQVAFDRWRDWVEYVQVRPDQTILIDVVRDGRTFTTDIVPQRKTVEGKEVGLVGIWVSAPPLPDGYLKLHKFPFYEALWVGLQETGSMALFTLQSIGKLVRGDISPKNLSGPITIAQAAGDTARMGVESYLGFLALLSISLGVLNLLPIPVLDGGHLLFYFIEAIKGGPVPERIQNLGFQVGLLVIVSIMMLAIYNDLMRL